MSDLSRQRCAHHAHREAAARCPQCERYYCRECVTEHEGRVLCTSCLGTLTARSRKSGRRFKGAARFLLFFWSVFALWFFFYLCATVLL